MTAATDVLPDVDVDVDLDSEKACEAIWAKDDTPICDRAAAWCVVYACCGYRKLLCDGCYKTWIFVDERNFSITCLRCKFLEPKIISAYRI